MIISFRHAVAFLTRLPGGAHPSDQEAIARSVPYFPVVGLLVGGLGAGTFWAGSEVFTPAIGAALSLIGTALVTGGLHEDGLADSMDALAGGWDREQRMEIFHDSRHGTFGVLSLVLISLLKFSALLTLSGSTAALVIVASHVMARSAAVVVMAILPSARAEGLGADYGKTLPFVPTMVAAGLGLIGAIVAFGVLAPAVVASVVAAGVVVSAWAVRKIGGATGDILGAVEQVSECAVLLTGVAVLI